MKFLIFLLFFMCGFGQSSWGGFSSTTHLKILQMNIWQEGTIVKGGFDAIIDEIIHTDADIIFFSEVRNYNNQQFVPRVLDALEKKGKHYYGNQKTALDVAILSKYKLSDQVEVYPNGEGSGSILRTTIQIGKQTIAAYSAHLNYTNYACYLPRGYDGFTWKKLDTPVSCADSVLVANRKSWRDQSIRIFLQEARKDIEKGHLVIFGGDFNEPSHLDWQANTKDKWDHNGLVIDWDCSTLLYGSGFRDAYRILHPNVETHPGFTFPSDNKDVPVSKLAWAPEADERDRIDFIYYYPMPGFIPVKASILGPDSSIVRGKRMKEDSQDPFIAPRSVWPSDHKALVVEFTYDKVH